MLAKVNKSFLYKEYTGVAGTEIDIKDSETFELLTKKGLVEKAPEKNMQNKVSDAHGKSENKN